MGVHGEFGDDGAVRRGQVEADRTIGRGGDVGDFPGVVTVPQQEGFGDLLHVSGGQLPVCLAIDQGEVTRMERAIMLRTVAPTHHVMRWSIHGGARRWRGLGVRNRRTGHKAADHQSGGGHKGFTHLGFSERCVAAYMAHQRVPKPLIRATNCKELQRSFRIILGWLM